MRTLSAGLVLAAVLFAAGCGGSSGGGGGSSRASGEASKSAEAVVADASKAAQDAGSFHMAGTIHGVSSDLGTGGVGLDLSVVRDKGATGTLTVGGADVDLVVAGNSGYMRADSAFWKNFAKQQAGGAAASFAASLFGNKWLKFPANNKQFQALTAPTKANSIFKSLTSSHGTLTNAGETTYKGQSAVAIHSSKEGTLYVAATGTPYPVALLKTGGKTGGAITFDNWKPAGQADSAEGRARSFAVRRLAMKRSVDAPDGLRWIVKRLIVPTGFRPLTRTEMLDAASPRRTTVEGMSRQVPDAALGPTGPVPLGFLFLPLALPLIPPVLLLRRMRLLPWTIEARTFPWGRRQPPVVLTYLVRGDEESRRAFDQLVEALARGDGSPSIDGAEKIGQQRAPHDGPPVVGTTGPKQFGN